MGFSDLFLVPRRGHADIVVAAEVDLVVGILLGFLIDVDAELTRVPGAPLMFMLRDPDGNHLVVVEAPPA